jgi:hypothetical protein
MGLERRGDDFGAALSKVCLHGFAKSDGFEFVGHSPIPPDARRVETLDRATASEASRIV